MAQQRTHKPRRATNKRSTGQGAGDQETGRQEVREDVRKVWFPDTPQ